MTRDERVPLVPAVLADRHEASARLRETWAPGAVTAAPQSTGNHVLRLDANVGIGYDVVATAGIFEPANKTLSSYVGPTKVYCIVDRNVHALYWASCSAFLEANDIPYECFVFDASESTKRMVGVEAIASFCVDRRIRRRDTVLCIGGGITCDVGGLAASLLRRGTPCVKIPTTLMAVVDAAVGVKTGVNFGRQKNSLGTYAAPAAVIYDLALLGTLPQRQIRNGLVEVIKIIAVKDARLWSLLEQHLDGFFTPPYGEPIARLIGAAIALMLEELSTNLHEQNLRRIVDYGHEFGHAIEIATRHELQHGEAVGVGMLLSNAIAERQGVLGSAQARRFTDLYLRLDLPVFHGAITIDALESALDSARRHKNGALDLVSLQRLGQPTFLADVAPAELRAAKLAISALERARRAAVPLRATEVTASPSGPESMARFRE